MVGRRATLCTDENDQHFKEAFPKYHRFAMEKHPPLPGNNFVQQVCTALESGDWMNIRDMKTVLMPSRARCKFDKILKLVPYYPDTHSVNIQRAMARYAILPAFELKHIQRHPLRFHKLTQDDLEREVMMIMMMMITRMTTTTISSYQTHRRISSSKA
ncbi:MAG: hypothetical protein CMH49_04255 [Myxococcales bacterium]|nr:hypothetical protein [Myxococcales bacterium]